jgi:hypothetical protein
VTENGGVGWETTDEGRRDGRAVLTQPRAVLTMKVCNSVDFFVELLIFLYIL